MVKNSRTSCHNASCDDCVCFEKASRQACALLKRAQKYDRFLRGKQIGYMLNEHLSEIYEAVQGLSVFNTRLQNDDVQDFDVRWDQTLLSASETPTEMVLEGFFKSKLRAVSDGHPGYPRLKKAGRSHIDQVMRTKHFKARNEIVERRAVTKTQKKKNQR